MPDSSSFSEPIPPENGGCGRSPFADPNEPCEQESCDAEAHGEEHHEPCPTPLSWQQVLESFIEDSSRWEMIGDDGAVLRGHTWGSGPALYFLGPMVGDARLFALMMYLLKEDFQCVVLNYPREFVQGEQRVRAGKVKRTAADFARDVEQVADAHEHDTFTVYGSGFGSLIALQVALNVPDRVTHLVLQSGYAQRRLSLFERTLASLGRRSRRELSQVRGHKTIQQQNHAPWFPPYDFSRWEFYLENVGETTCGGIAQRAGSVKWVDLRQSLGDVACPVLLIRGEGEGKLSAEAAAVLEEKLTIVQVEWLHTTGHLPFVTHPHRLKKLILTFSQDEFAAHPVPEAAVTS